MFKSRLALAATLSGNYGIYNGFELLEHQPIPGREEYLNSEKYEIKTRNWNKPGNIKPYITALNRARRANPALLQTRNLRFLPIENGNVIAFAKHDTRWQATSSSGPSRCRATCRNSGCRSTASTVNAGGEPQAATGAGEPDHQ